MKESNSKLRYAPALEEYSRMIRQIYNGHEYRFHDDVLINSYGTQVAHLEPWTCDGYWYAVDSETNEVLDAIRKECLVVSNESLSIWLVRAYAESVKETVE